MIIANLAYVSIPSGPRGTSLDSQEVLLKRSPLSDCRYMQLDSADMRISFEKGKDTIISLLRSGKPTTTIKGRYDINDNSAVLTSSSIVLEGHTVNFIEAKYSNDDLILLLWQVEDMLYPFTTATLTTGTVRKT